MRQKVQNMADFAGFFYIFVFWGTLGTGGGTLFHPERPQAQMRSQSLWRPWRDSSSQLGRVPGHAPLQDSISSDLSSTG
eukprot:2809298-Amphidinium_carterae.1